MSRRIPLLLRLGFGCTLVLATSMQLSALAQPDDEEEPAAAEDEEEDEGEEEDEEEAEVDEDGIPRGYRRVELLDITTGMRDDHFASIEVAPDGRVMVGTFEGRSYISRDEGITWDESWVLPESKGFFGFTGQYMFLGKVRSDHTHRASVPNLAPGWGSAGMQYGLAASRWLSVGGFHSLPTEQPPVFRRGGSAGGLSTDLPTNYQPTTAGLGSISANPGAISPLSVTAGAAAGDPGVTLGAALSSRAPRLSLLLLARGRPTAIISLQRLLISIALRLTDVRKIVPDPADPKHLMAATWYGLYQSYDGGVSWVRTFAGMTLAERGVYDIVFDPRDPKRVYLASSRGVFISDNSGDGWKKVTAAPEMLTKKIAIDPTNSNNVYVAGLGAMWRSSDRLKSMSISYYSALPRWNDVIWIAIDPNDVDTAYLGTGAGIVKTTNLRQSTARDWQFLKPARLEGLVNPVVATCSKHPGHIYTMTRADLVTINYGSHGPEALLLESWDGGQNWRVLASLRTAGDIRWFTLDPRDPDQVWIAFSRALVRVKRVPDTTPSEPVEDTGPALPGELSIGELLEATQRYHKLDIETYQWNLDKLRYGNWLPSVFNLTFAAGRERTGAVHDDFQFAEDRYRALRPTSEWRIMAFGTWRLPDIWYEPKTITMQRVRELMMNDEIRNRLRLNIQRNYGELLRLKVRQMYGGERDLYTRAVEQVRMEQLEAIVDLASGGYLSRYKKKRARERVSKRKREER
jgi:hypothetical protein